MPIRGRVPDGLPPTLSPKSGAPGSAEVDNAALVRRPEAACQTLQSFQPLLARQGRQSDTRRDIDYNFGIGESTAGNRRARGRSGFPAGRLGAAGTANLRQGSGDLF